MQIIKVMTSHHGVAHARRRIVIFMEPKSRTRDLGPTEGQSLSQALVAVSTIFEPRDQIPAGLWAEGTLQPYNGVQYISPYLPRRAVYMENGGTDESPGQSTIRDGRHAPETQS